MSTFVTALPALTIALATLIAVLPWGLPIDDMPWLGHAMPLLAFATLYFWLICRPRSTPLVLAFLSGLVVDVVTRGPLGLWPLIFLCGLAPAVALAPVLDGGRVARVLGFAVIAAVLAGLQWAVASGYYLRRPDGLPIFTAALLAALAYPFLDMALGALGGPRRPSNPVLSRGA